MVRCLRVCKRCKWGHEARILEGNQAPSTFNGSTGMIVLVSDLSCYVRCGAVWAHGLGELEFS